jgi:hypothetical protein
MNLKYIKITALFLAAALLGSCSMTTKITIETSEPGALVNLDGKIIGTTPIINYKVKNRFGKEYPVLIRKDGCEDYYGRLKTEQKLASLVGSIFLVPILFLDGPQKLQYFKLTPEAAQ